MPQAQADLGVGGVLPKGVHVAAPGNAGMVAGLAEGKLADGAAVDPLQSLDEELVGLSLEIDQEAQFLFRGFPSAGPDGLATRDVHGDGFGDIDVLAGGDTRGGMLGMKIRRRFDDHGVQFLLQQTLVAGQSVVLPFRWDADFLAGSLGAIPEVVGRRHEVVAAVLLEQACDPGASAPAANDADIDLGVGGIAKGKVRANHGESRGEPAPITKPRRVTSPVDPVDFVLFVSFDMSGSPWKKGR